MTPNITLLLLPLPSALNGFNLDGLHLIANSKPNTLELEVEFAIERAPLIFFACRKPCCSRGNAT